MSTEQMKSEIYDRVELTLQTDATLTDAEKVHCEADIRKALDVEGIVIDSLVFRDGSTIIAICLSVVEGLSFCFAKLIGGAFSKLGGRAVEKLWPKSTTPSASNEEKPPAPPVPMKSITVSGLEEAGVPGIDTQEQASIAATAESVTRDLVDQYQQMRGIKKTIIFKITYIDPDTKELVEEIHQKSSSKL
jgi:hypothetical protein